MGRGQPLVSGYRWMPINRAHLGPLQEPQEWDVRTDVRP